MMVLDRIVKGAECWAKGAGLSIWREIRQQLRLSSQTLVALLLPRDCMLCGGGSGQHFLCIACTAALPMLTKTRCPVCAQPLPGLNANDHLPCGQCLANPPNFDATIARYVYEFPLDEVIQQLKYRHRLASAHFLGNALIEATADLLPTEKPDVIIPVPLSTERLAERGFNQSLEVAKPLAHHLGVSIRADALQRVRHTLPQVQLPWKERAKNIRHAFVCRERLDGLHVWVVDDVMTTGATLNEIAGALKASGAAQVTNVVVARAVRRQS
jgi:ComF family protein